MTEVLGAAIKELLGEQELLDAECSYSTQDATPFRQGAAPNAPWLTTLTG
ncbi:MAG: hypothetical protein U0350_18410 [Caldilineaceae bacterium]